MTPNGSIESSDQAWTSGLAKSWPAVTRLGTATTVRPAAGRRHGAVVGVLQGDGIAADRRRGARGRSCRARGRAWSGPRRPGTRRRRIGRADRDARGGRRPTRGVSWRPRPGARPAVTAASIRSTTPGRRSMASISTWCWACRAGTTVSRSMGRPRSFSSISLQWTWSAVPTISCHTARSSSTPCSVQTSAAVEKADHSVSRMRPSKSKTRACSVTGSARRGRRPARGPCGRWPRRPPSGRRPGPWPRSRARCRPRVAGPGPGRRPRGSGSRSRTR